MQIRKNVLSKEKEENHEEKTYQRNFGDDNVCRYACRVRWGGDSKEAPEETGGESTEEKGAEEGDVELSMWFWGSTAEQQAALSENLVDKFNEEHPGYHLTVEYRSSVNKDMAVALSADEGPDIIYESSPSLALTYIHA